jgi:hypothetical protein
MALSNSWNESLHVCHNPASFVGMMFNHSIPPKSSKKKTLGQTKELLFLHDDYEKRKSFYERFLVPTGHAEFCPRDQSWYFSPEFIEAVRNHPTDRLSLRALFNLTQ